MADRRPSARAFFADPVGFAAAHPDEPLVELREPTGRQALVQDPAEAWRILVADAARFRQGKWKRRAERFLGPTLNTLDGPEHRERRLLLQRALDRKKVAAARPLVANRAERLLATWTEGDEIRLREVVDPLSLAMAGDVLLGVDLEPCARELARALSTVMAHVPRLTPPLPGTARARALRTVRRTALELLHGGDGGTESLLAILRASDLPERTRVGEITAFLLAAVDEPPSGLAAAWWLLGADPERDRRLHDEIVAAGDGPTGEPAFLEAVIAEALRLLPPARHVDRCPVADEVVCGTRVRAGTNLLVSPLVLHHSAGAFGDPERFEPERWLDGRSDAVPRGAYVPFGAGPHTCIGEPLARLIMATTLATVARHWRLRPVGEQRAPVPGAPDLRFVLERR